MQEQFKCFKWKYSGLCKYISTEYYSYLNLNSRMELEINLLFGMLQNSRDLRNRK